MSLNRCGIGNEFGNQSADWNRVSAMVEEIKTLDSRRPNEGWSDWQWRDLCDGATTFDLTGAPDGFRPIVQPVPDVHFNTLLGHVFEGRVGNGSLLVCGYNVTTQLEQRPDVN
jgi:hypothetical protein